MIVQTQAGVIEVQHMESRTHLTLTGNDRKVLWVSNDCRGGIIQPGDLLTIETDGDHVIGVLLRLV